MQRYPNNVVLEQSACPNGCLPNDRFILEGQDRLHNLPGRFNIVECKTCNLRRTNPRPSSNSIGFYYPDTYGPYNNQPTQSAEIRSSPSKLKRAVAKLLNMQSRVLPDIPSGTLLEIGCASGDYLLEMQKLGWVVEGIEFSSSAAEKALKAGLKVQITSLENACPPQKKVNLIVAWMVLEHLHQPVECLNRMYEWIQPDGYLVASVPDSSSIINSAFGEYCYDLHLPNHLYHYSDKTIEKILEKSGWKLEKVVWQKNSSTFLNSLIYIAKDKNLPNLERFVNWLKISYSARNIRLLLNLLLGITKQSGRIEIWARPNSKK